jgi:hypothetical protein
MHFGTLPTSPGTTRVYFVGTPLMTCPAQPRAHPLDWMCILYAMTSYFIMWCLPQVCVPYSCICVQVVQGSKKLVKQFGSWRDPFAGTGINCGALKLSRAASTLVCNSPCSCLSCPVLYLFECGSKLVPIAAYGTKPQYTSMTLNTRSC